MTQNKTVPFTPVQQAAIDQFEAGAAIKTITKRISDLIHSCLGDQEERGGRAENTHLGRLIKAQKEDADESMVAYMQQSVDACPHCSEIVKLHEERNKQSRKRAGARIRLNRIAKSLIEAEQADGESHAGKEED